MKASAAHAIICAAELVAEAPKARRGANLSATVGQEAMALSNETISALHLASGHLWSAVSEAAWLADLPPGCLCLEVTETAVMADPVTASAVLMAILAVFLFFGIVTKL